VLGAAALACAATGVAAPVGAVLGGVAAATSGLAAYNHASAGDSGLDIALSAVGAIPGLGSGIARGVRWGIRGLAEIPAHGKLIARSVGAVLKGARIRLDAIGDALYLPVEGVTSWCGGWFWSIWL
ncbi:MAG: hypothetical protein LBC97_02180, partial [Bifidobacteriaceae bacterium]|jgi:hypothetical protein|nr:hypothetical protein [Bifidobacteriaceae bacterium]